MNEARLVGMTIGIGQIAEFTIEQKLRICVAIS
jgi:hypothetical protein